MIYRGIPYIAFGSRSEWTNGKTAIEKVWRPIPYSERFDLLATLHFRWVIVLKVRLFDSSNPYQKKVYEVADRLANKKVQIWRFGEIVEVEDEETFTMESYYSKQDGSYIGLVDDVYRYFTRFGISEFYNHGTGWSPRDQKWYGWSHRAIAGFGIGSERVEGDIAFDEYGYMKAETLEDAKLMAEQFARDVG